MEAKQWTTVDKSAWPRVAWDSEPDKMQWTDEATGLPCLIVRAWHGALCGYVGVASGRDFERDYGRVDVCVHGGLTFADFCRPGEDAHSICHIPGPGEPERVWWLGFDCAHLNDYSPGSIRDWPFGEETYKDVAYVQGHVRELARQLAARWK